MKTPLQTVFLVAATLLLPIGATARADTFGSGSNTFNLPFVPIGNPRNVPDIILYGGYGGVSYRYEMSVTEVSQTMLATAATLSGLNLGGGVWTGNQPAITTWYEAAAFVNWLNTSQGYTAAYNLTFTGNHPTGIMSWKGADVWTSGGLNFFRNSKAHYFLPSENEWFKAAYYDPNKAGGAGYWEYANGSDTAPTPVASGTTVGTAVYNGVVSQPAAVDQSGGLSPYGTQGQGGNVPEWMETSYNDPMNGSDELRAVRGGNWYLTAGYLRRSHRDADYPTDSLGIKVGFRVASVPEPGAAVSLLLAGSLLLARRPSAL